MSFFPLLKLFAKIKADKGLEMVFNGPQLPGNIPAIPERVTFVCKGLWVRHVEEPQAALFTADCMKDPFAL